MLIEEKLPKKNLNCQENEYENVEDLQKIHQKQEMCILKAFQENWGKGNKSCHPFVFENYEIL